MTTIEITDIFQQMKQGQDLTVLLPNATTKEYYFFIKAYKLVDSSNFYAYCAVHKDLNTYHTSGVMTPFHQMLCSILEVYYPPLEPNHPLEKGMDGLDTYVEIAKEIFQ